VATTCLAGREQALLSLIEEQQLGRVVLGFEFAISKSFASDTGLTLAPVTHAKVKERFEICVRIFRVLRGDLKWGVERIMGHLPHYLRCELDGLPWEPDARATWAAQDSA